MRESTAPWRSKWNTVTAKLEHLPSQEEMAATLRQRTEDSLNGHASQTTCLGPVSPIRETLE